MNHNLPASFDKPFANAQGKPVGHAQGKLRMLRAGIPSTEGSHPDPVQAKWALSCRVESRPLSVTTMCYCTVRSTSPTRCNGYATHTP
jgi:hypothetical protein